MHAATSLLCMTQSREAPSGQSVVNAISRQIYVGCHPLEVTFFPCQVLDDFPCSHHRPSLVHVGLTLPVVRNTCKKGRNFRKTNWDNSQPPLTKPFPPLPGTASQSFRLTIVSPGPCPKQPTPLSPGESVLCTYLVWTTKTRCYWTSMKNQEIQLLLTI